MSRDVGDRFNYSLWTVNVRDLEDFYLETVMNSLPRRSKVEII